MNKPSGGPTKGNWTPPFIPEDTSDLTEFLYLWSYTRFWQFDVITEDEKTIIGNFIYQWLAAIISGVMPVVDLPLPQPPRPKVELPLYKGVVTAGRLRIRTGPSLTNRQSSETPWLIKNSLVDVYEERSGLVLNWLRLSLREEAPRWVAKKYVSKQDDFNR